MSWKKTVALLGIWISCAAVCVTALLTQTNKDAFVATVLVLIGFFAVIGTLAVTANDD